MDSREEKIINDIQSDKPHVWLSALKSFSELDQGSNHKGIKYIENKFSDSNADLNKYDLKNKVPNIYKTESQLIRSYLDEDEIASFCYAIIKQTTKSKLKKEAMEDLLYLISSGNYIAKREINKLTESQRQEFTETAFFNKKYRNNPHVNTLLKLRKYIMDIALDDENLLNKWNRLERSEQLKTIYIRLSNNRNMEVLNGLNEGDPIVNSILDLINESPNTQYKSKELDKFKELLNKFVAESATNMEEPINAKYLLPKCFYSSKTKVEYCEGREWKKQDTIYCPRLGSSCPAKEAGDYPIYPNIGRKWHEWSLHEILDIGGYLHSKEDKEFVNGLSGWVNRLNEIRNTLKCSKCGQPLVPDLKYAKNMAKYRRTVFYCKDQCDKNTNIYISHCWCCNKTIDNRVDKVKVNNYYLCRNCGSGERGNYRRDYCPDCGSYAMHFNEDYPKGEKMKCNACEYIIKIPNRCLE
ncbi:hypothetical protein [Isachenkonia alkalipeptolytica]|uniref:Uncharacterized protein n=1 Tax=Isachenkonia alkalipeptolytica TaxID=2565777 RepID=A0AA43XK68_9CLOT|nr:hypothetical protein [Isachenkonia alkalipeptolytica]NBG87684.1 hypothetical protein [Isachenkonia alkalipeptolytica]